MLVYWTVYLLPSLLAMTRLRMSHAGWFGLGTLLALVIGLRYHVGTDWPNYVVGYYLPAGRSTLFETLSRPDPLFQLLNWLANAAGLGIWFVNFVVAAVFSAGLVRFVRRTPEPLIALSAAIPYLSLIVAMNYTRQAAAIGVVLWALIELYDGRLARYVALIFIAALFHKSAILFVPFFVFYKSRNRFALVLIAAGMGALGYFLVLAEQFDSLWQQYVTSDYSQASQGASLRVAMNALPAIVFLLFRSRFRIEPVAQRIWTAVACASLAAMLMVFWAPTAVDRVALYFSPIQFVLASYIVAMVHQGSRALARLAVLGVYASVLYVWLTYAANAPAWFPYQVWPFLSKGFGPI